MEESFDIINSRTKPLAAYLFTKDKILEEKFVNNVSSGGMLINDVALHVIILAHQSIYRINCMYIYKILYIYPRNSKNAHITISHLEYDFSSCTYLLLNLS